MYIMVRDNGDKMNKINKNLSYKKSRKGAFTLAEVLITLGIIGAVAVLTIVPLVKNYQEKVLVNRLKETYSMLSRAHQMAVVANGDPESWDLGGNDRRDNWIKLYNYYKPFLKITKYCGDNNSKGCFYKGRYKALFNNTYNYGQDVGRETGVGFIRVQLINGASAAFWTPGTCSSGNCGHIMVDVNGPKPPNRAGVDYFYLTIKTGGYGLIPNSGGITKPKNCTSWCCTYNNTSDTNGVTCTGWVITKGNMDYLRRDISNEW